jgi:hypothetical protein
MLDCCKHSLVALLASLALVTVVRGAETFAPEPKSGWPMITANYPLDGKPDAVLGKLKVSGKGRVTFLANRTQNRLVITAVGVDGSQLGRAESVVGLGDTPIYVRSLQGLLKVIVHWRS